MQQDLGHPGLGFPAISAGSRTRRSKKRPVQLAIDAAAIPNYERSLADFGEKSPVTLTSMDSDIGC